MKLTSVNFTVVAATTLFIHSIFVLSASSIAVLPESYTISGNLSALNLSLPTNMTDANDISIEGCGVETRNVQRAYLLARAGASIAKVDVVRGAHSPFGFSAMFKSDRSKYPVSYYLNMIIDSKGVIDLKPARGRATPPRFVCVHQNTARAYRSLRLGYNPWERCTHPQPGQRFAQSFYAVDTAYIFLCPDFHSQAPAPTGSHCPTVVDNKFVGDVDVFYQDYQMYMLLYELLRFYLQKNALTSRSLPKEVSDWNQCVAYSVESSVKNPTNTLLYIALAQQLCLAAPNPFEPPFAPPSPTTTPPAVNMWQTPTPGIPDMVAGARLTGSEPKIAVTSVAPVVSLMLPLPYSETS